MTIRLLLFVFSGVFVFAQMAGAADPIATHARIDVVAESEFATLSNGKWSFENGSFVKRMTWLTDKRHRATYFGEFNIVDFAAAPTVFSFVADRDTQVKVELLGIWRDDGRGGAKRLMVDWEGFSASGAQIIGKPFQPKTTWARDPIQLTLQVQKGVPVYLQLAAKAHREQRKTAKQNTRAHQLATRLKRGINLSNWLEVPPNEDWGDNACDGKDFAAISRSGFDHVRLPVGWQHRTGPRPDYRINEAVYRKVDRVIKLANDFDLALIIDIHHFDRFTEDPKTHRAKFVSLWKQISQRYAGLGDDVFFEILNEPSEAATAEVMNDVYAETIRVIRQTNPNRGILVGPADFNSVYQLANLELPADDEALIVSFHNYDPFPFTHQGANWTIPGVRGLRNIPFPGPSVNRLPMIANAHDYSKRWIEDFNSVRDPKFNVGGTMSIVRMLEMAKGWSDTHGRPVHLGEFGAFLNADDASRASYYRAVRTAAEERGIGWAAWSWRADFAYFDEKRRTPRPGMRAALFE